MTHGRDQLHDLEVGVRRDGTIVGLRVRSLANVGAYPIRGAFIPMGHADHGVGRVPHPRHRVPRCPRRHEHDADRSVPGRGPARSRRDVRARVELVASSSGSTRVVRERNFIPKEAFPYRRPPVRPTTPASTCSRCRKRSAQRARALAHGTAGPPRCAATRMRSASASPATSKSAGAGTSTARSRVESDGSATVVTGSVPGGQGHETVWAQIVSSVTGIPFERVRSCTPIPRRADPASARSGSRSLQLAGTRRTRG